jgi:hypothetical protein
MKDEDAGLTASVSAHCGTCYVNGTGVATIKDVQFDDSVFQTPVEAAEEFLTDPLQLIQSSFDVEMDFSLSNFTGYFEFNVTFSGSGTFTIPVPIPPTPLGGTVS